jgi:hypothetical protein
MSRDMDDRLDFPVQFMNRLNETEPTISSIMPFRNAFGFIVFPIS